jgi:6,7-dimethyl-8-ribityllumazine synthase
VAVAAATFRPLAESALVPLEQGWWASLLVMVLVAGAVWLVSACLGAVIRGETDHYDHVCREAASGIARVSLDTGVPCAFGVLTVDTMEQALARTGGGKRHQGEDAARAVLRMAELRRSLASGAA